MRWRKAEKIIYNKKLAFYFPFSFARKGNQLQPPLYCRAEQALVVMPAVFVAAAA